MEARPFLKECDLFRDVPEADLARLCAIAAADTFPKGTVIFRERDAAARFYVVETGVVEIGRHDQMAGKFVRLARLERGQSFGETGFFDERPRAATATAAVVPETTCLSWDRREFDTLIAADPLMGLRILRNMVRRLCGRLRQTDETIHTLWRSLNTG